MKYDLTIQGTIGSYAVSQEWVASQLAEIFRTKGKDAKRIDVRISSLGGALGHALDIRQQLRDCEAEVVAHIFSLTASAATVIATGARRTLISKYALYMVHRVSLSVDLWERLNAGELAAQIAKLESTKSELERMDLTLLALYAEKTGRSVEELRPILEEGRWLTAAEALALGFVDGYVEDAAEEDAQATAVAIDAYRNLAALPSHLADTAPAVPPQAPEVATAPTEAAPAAPMADTAESRNFFQELIDLLKQTFMSKPSENPLAPAPEQAQADTAATDTAPEQAQPEAVTTDTALAAQMATLEARLSALEAENATLREALNKQPGAAPDPLPEPLDDTASDYVSRAHEMAKNWLN